MSGYSEGPDWLGLLKWSLQYSDGTTDPSHVTPMSEEDKVFLTKVMEEGVRNDPKRMRGIMMDVAAYLEEFVEEGKSSESASEAISNNAIFREMSRNEQDDCLEQELDELQDIVEQIDMAEVFAVSMKGLGCILDIVEDKKHVVTNLQVRTQACSVLGTLAQNNLKVQEECFKTGAIGRLVSLAFRLLALPSSAIITRPEIDDESAPVDGIDSHTLGFYVDVTEGTTTDNYKILSKVISAISCAVRAHETAEDVLIRGQYGATLLKAVLTPAILSSGSSSSSSGTSSRDDESDIERACANAIESCRIKATFLWNALLNSDTINIEAKKQLLQAVPSCYNVLTMSSASSADGCSIGYDSNDLREKTLTLLSTVIKADGGLQIIREYNTVQNLHTLLTERLRIVTSSTVTLRQRISSNPEINELAKDDINYDIERNESESNRLQTLRRSLQ